MILSKTMFRAEAVEVNPFVIVKKSAKLRQGFLSVELLKSVDGWNEHVRTVVAECCNQRRNR
jgi:hypothetical protein